LIAEWSEIAFADLNAHDRRNRTEDVGQDQ
jgi:hypothetical protein